MSVILVTGTGTGVGKTFVSVGLAKAFARQGRAVVAYKPVESGVTNATESDAQALESASTFHVKPSLLHVRLQAPVAPVVAARLEGVMLDLDAIEAEVERAKTQADVVLLELAGGLFSPFAEGVTCADFAARLAPSAVVLVAPDRLGVLHDIIATCRAATGSAGAPTHVLLNTPDSRDASSGTNARELPLFVSLPTFGPIARGGLDASAFDEVARAITQTSR